MINKRIEFMTDAEQVVTPKFTKNADGSFTVTGGVFKNNAELSSFIESGLKNDDVENRAAAPVPSVAVKALEWKEINDVYSCAVSPLGTFHEVNLVLEGPKAGEWERSGGDVGLRYIDAEQAMKAEQADYEARIRSALSAQVPPK